MLGKYLGNEMSLHATDCPDRLKQQKKSLLRAVVRSACTSKWHESSLFIYFFFFSTFFTRDMRLLFEQ